MYTGKKLLILGGVPMLIEAVQWAQSQGAYVIVSDYYPNSPAKRVADEAWDVSTADIETLAKKCEAVGVDGVFSSFDDFNINKCALLSERLGLHFYASSAQTIETMDKDRFKANCLKWRVPTTPLVSVEDADYATLPYPLIVKPVDGSGSRGIKVCYEVSDLVAAIAKARDVSKSGRYLVEQYLDGDEVGTNYYLQDGKIAVSAMHDRYLQVECVSEVKLPLAYVYPSKYSERYLQYENDSVVNMFHKLGMRNGSLFLQGCVDKSGTVYYYEMGYRLNGAKQYQIIEGECGFNPMHCLINYSITGKMSEHDNSSCASPLWNSKYCTLSLLIKPGLVGDVVGLEQIAECENTIAITQWVFPGDCLDDSVLGTQKQIAARVTLKAPDYEELATAIDFVNSVFDVKSSTGESMMLETFDTKRLFV